MGNFNCEYGSVWYYQKGLEENCGIGFLYDVTFKPNYKLVAWGPDDSIPRGTRAFNKDIALKLFDEFNEYVKSEKILGDRNKIMMTDAVPEMSLSYMTAHGYNLKPYLFAKECGWIVHKPTYNRNSGNDVVIMESNKSWVDEGFKRHGTEERIDE